MYAKMFNAVTDAERLMARAAYVLRTVQLECERLYTEAPDTPIELAEREPERTETDGNLE
jgi:hypothetical protein